jgi:hypothetical protein
MIRDVHPGSGSLFFIHPDPGVKKTPDPGSATLSGICQNIRGRMNVKPGYPRKINVTPGYY